jgi:CheY-like chemotaxis protein
LVLLDLKMPWIDGIAMFDALEKKSNSILASIAKTIHLALQVDK